MEIFDPEAKKSATRAKYIRRQRRKLMLPLAAYVKVCEGRVHKTVEIVKGHVYCDYARNGILIGVEVI